MFISDKQICAQRQICCLLINNYDKIKVSCKIRKAQSSKCRSRLLLPSQIQEVCTSKKCHLNVETFYFVWSLSTYVDPVMNWRHKQGVSCSHDPADKDKQFLIMEFILKPISFLWDQPSNLLETNCLLISTDMLGKSGQGNCHCFTPVLLLVTTMQLSRPLLNSNCLNGAQNCGSYFIS